MNLCKFAFFAIRFPQYTAHRRLLMSLGRKMSISPQLKCSGLSEGSSYIWTLAVSNVGEKCIQLAQLAHFAMPSSSILEEKKVHLWGRKQHGLFQLHRTEWTACCCHCLEAESNEFNLSIMFLVPDDERRAKRNLASALTGWIEILG